MAFEKQIEFAYEPTVMYTTSEAWPQAREPVLRRMADGSLCSLLYMGGPSEPHPENVVGIVRSYDDGKTWGEPEVVCKHPTRPTWGTEIFTDGPRPFAAFHTYVYETFFTEIRAFFSYTDDSGKTWSEPFGIPGVPPNLSIRQGRILQDGSWIFPVYWVEQTRLYTVPGDRGWQFCCGAIRSTNQGKSYSLHGYIIDPEPLQFWEPEIIECEAGHLRMYIRSSRGFLYESESFDSGLTWSEAHTTGISNPGTKVVVYRVGDKLAMFNNTCSKEHSFRDVLELLISDDNGKTWSRSLPVAKLKQHQLHVWNDDHTVVTQVAYPHGFTDDERQMLYLAIDGVREFYMVKIPYSDILGC